MGRNLALVHGCTGPLYFSLCAAMVVVTSRRWRVSQEKAPTPVGVKLTRFAVIFAVVAHLQLFAGAVLRHGKLMIGESSEAIFQTAVYFHMLLAALVVVQVAVLTVRCLRSRTCSFLASGLAALVAVQIGLGVFTWLLLYGVPRWATLRWGEWYYLNQEADVIRSGIISAHGAVGSLIAALATVTALMAARTSGVRLRMSLAAPISLAGAMV